MQYEYGGRNTHMFQKLPGFKNVIAWQQASDLSALIVETVKNFGAGWWKLADQMRTAAWSVGGNIAEGYGRSSIGDYVRFCEIARGSLHELGSYLQDCERAKLIPADQLTTLITRYSQATLLLDRLLQGIQKRRQQGEWRRGVPIKESEPTYSTDSAEPEWAAWGAPHGPSDFLA